MTLTEPELGAVIVAFIRAGGLAVTAPVIGDAPARVRLAFAVAIAVGVGLNRPGVPIVELPLVAIVELGMGLLTGTCARFVMARIAVAGQLVGLSLGLGFASQFDPEAGESASSVRILFTTIAGLVFLAAGGLEAVVRSTANSPTHVAEVALLGPEVLRQGTAAFSHGLALAGPVVFAALVANVGLAVMNRAAPAINVFSISLAAVMIIGGIVLVATSSSLIAGMAAAVDDAIRVLG
jgi:flagellar biosynthesis protein FliR